MCCILLPSYGVGHRGRLHREEHRGKPGRAELAGSLRQSNRARSVMGHPSMTEVAGWVWDQSCMWLSHRLHPHCPPVPSPGE